MVKKLVMLSVLLSALGGGLWASNSHSGGSSDPFVSDDSDSSVEGEDQAARALRNLDRAHTEDEQEAVIEQLVALSRDEGVFDDVVVNIVERLRSFIEDLDDEQEWNAAVPAVKALAEIGKNRKGEVAAACVRALFTWVRENQDSNFFGDVIDALNEIATGVGFAEYIRDYIDEGVEEEDLEEDEEEYDSECDEDEEASGERARNNPVVEPFDDYYERIEDQLVDHIRLRMIWVGVCVQGGQQLERRIRRAARAQEKEIRDKRRRLRG